jgi:hypothetical protein
VEILAECCAQAGSGDGLQALQTMQVNPSERMYPAPALGAHSSCLTHNTGSVHWFASAPPFSAAGPALAGGRSGRTVSQKHLRPQRREQEQAQHQRRQRVPTAQSALSCALVPSAGRLQADEWGGHERSEESPVRGVASKPLERERQLAPVAAGWLAGAR